MDRKAEADGCPRKLVSARTAAENTKELPAQTEVELTRWVFVRGENIVIRTLAKQLLSATLSFLLVIGTAPLELGAEQIGYSGQGVPLSAEELQQLVAPIALYPDALVAQVLGAASFPDQVAFAANWLKQDSNLTGTILMQAVDAQQWDPAVKALTQFPPVLQNMAKNLSWTSALGEAYATQGSEVMLAVQVLRAKAQAAGNLKSGSQITVVQQSPQTIVIQSTNPEMVYVPVYNPAVVYGSPYVTPGYNATALVTTGVLAFGAGIAVGAMMSGGCCGWGYSSWNCGWHGTSTVVYRGGTYYGNTAWRGYTTTASGAYGTAHYSAGYNSATGTYVRGVTASNGYGSVSAGQAYNPRTGTYVQGVSVSNANGTQSTAQAYNPRTGAYGATEQGSNSNGGWGSSTVSKNGNTVYTQHQTTAQGSVGTVQTSAGGRGVVATGAYGNAAAVETPDGNKYAAANGNLYKNTGSGWQQTQGASKPTSGYSGTNTTAARGYGGQERNGSTAFSGGGWQSRQASARGSWSRGSGGGWGGRR